MPKVACGNCGTLITYCQFDTPPKYCPNCLPIANLDEQVLRTKLKVFNPTEKFKDERFKMVGIKESFNELTEPTETIPEKSTKETPRREKHKRTF